ncbi:trypsin-like cysteine/serine peptidase domain-containing protein [Elsinoe ampelina]|uniref:Trypsin-like cysteine/serine peptidase domain-containing protein n=1 Tax=Elsinoe ampelina TaxID=302913 RepID=A0A6A6G0Z3_9PEZI|nr:trypsin-like cysteine/serine peptidase domain-containing protein [Elsinoe ampelina]
MRRFLLVVVAATLLRSSWAIIGGQPADGSFAYTVALVQPRIEGNPRGYTSFLCDGILVSPTAVITATECTSWLRAEDISIRSGLTPETQQNTTVSEIITLQPLNYTTLSYNLAVLRLSSPLDDIEPAKLAQPISTEFPSMPGRARLSALRIFGWGPTTNGTQSISSALNYAPVDTIDTGSCSEKLGTCGFTLNPTEKLCTSSDGRGAAAFGDVGGPVVDEEGIVVAVISGNPTCAQPNGIGLKLKVNDPKIAAFIKQHADLEEAL